MAHGFSGSAFMGDRQTLQYSEGFQYYISSMNLVEDEHCVSAGDLFGNEVA